MMLSPNPSAILICGVFGAVPTSTELRDWSHLYSTDLAALVLARQLSRQAQGQPLGRLFHEELSAVLRARQSGDLDALAVDTDFLILFVPGWLYKSDPATGADFARFRTLLSRHGARVALIETGENLSVEENAKLIEAEIRRLAVSRQQLILVSGSKGGPEVALALSMLRDDPAGRQVKAWLNIGGRCSGRAAELFVGLTFRPLQRKLQMRYRKMIVVGGISLASSAFKLRA